MKLISLIITSFSILAFNGDIDSVNFNGPKLILNERITPIQTSSFENALNKTQIRIKISGNNIERLVSHDPVEVDCDKGIGRLEFKNRFFEIKSQSYFYVEGNVECGKLNVWEFERESEAAQVLEIYHQAITARNKFQALNLESFWKRKINIRWPSNGDYYSWGTVNITRGDHWDVVAHEIGHAIYDQADIGVSGGGRHRIDECYTNALALSEGWATFFAGWLNLRLNDQDARFEFLVPRRAPIRLENIPSDVCAGQRNEWRVAGFFWDLIDKSRDNEHIEMDFKTVWNLKVNKNYRSTKQFATVLLNHTDPVLLRAMWKNNFLTDLE